MFGKGRTLFLYKVQIKLYWNLLYGISDLRKSTCYYEYSRGVCRNALDDLHTRAKCCCTIGKAWSPQCEPCPREGTGTLFPLSLFVTHHHWQNFQRIYTANLLTVTKLARTKYIMRARLVCTVLLVGPEYHTSFCSTILLSVLTLFHTMPHFDALKIYSCGKHCEKMRNCL